MTLSVWLWMSVRRVVRRWSGSSDVWTQRSRSWPSQPEEPWGPPWPPPSPRNDRSSLPLCRRSSLRIFLQWWKSILGVLRIQASTLEADGDVLVHHKLSNLVLMNQYNGTDPCSPRRWRERNVCQTFQLCYTRLLQSESAHTLENWVKLLTYLYYYYYTSNTLSKHRGREQTNPDWIWRTIADAEHWRDDGVWHDRTSHDLRECFIWC